MRNPETLEALKTVTYGSVLGFIFSVLIGIDIGLAGFVSVCIFSLLSIVLILQELL